METIGLFWPDEEAGSHEEDTIVYGEHPDVEAMFASIALMSDGKHSVERLDTIAELEHFLEAQQGRKYTLFVSEQGLNELSNVNEEKALPCHCMTRLLLSWRDPHDNREEFPAEQMLTPFLFPPSPNRLSFPPLASVVLDMYAPIPMSLGDFVAVVFVGKSAAVFCETLGSLSGLDLVSATALCPGILSMQEEFGGQLNFGSVAANSSAVVLLTDGTGTIDSALLLAALLNRKSIVEIRSVAHSAIPPQLSCLPQVASFSLPTTAEGFKAVGRAVSTAVNAKNAAPEWKETEPAAFVVRLASVLRLSDRCSFVPSEEYDLTPDEKNTLAAPSPPAALPSDSALQSAWEDATEELLHGKAGPEVRFYLHGAWHGDPLLVEEAVGVMECTARCVQSRECEWGTFLLGKCSMWNSEQTYLVHAAVRNTIAFELNR